MPPRLRSRFSLAALAVPLLLGLASVPAGAALLHVEISGTLVRQTSSAVPAGLEAHLQSSVDGQALQIAFDLDLATPDILPAAGSAHYLQAVGASSLRIGGLDMTLSDFCSDSLTLDCSVEVENDQPAFGGLLDSYTLRSRNFSLDGAPPVPATFPLLSFLFSTGSFSLGGAPDLLSSDALDPGLQALIAAHPESLSINLQGIADCGAGTCYAASWGLSGLQVRVGAEDPAGTVPEPGSLALLLAGLALLGHGEFRRRPRSR